jgi:hypothetical protein
MFSTSSVTFGPSDGLMYVWDALNVLKQHSFNSTQFDNIGSVPNANSGDPGPIVFSGDGAHMLLSDGAGGNAPAQYNGVMFNLPAAGGAATTPVGTVAFNAAFVPLPASSSQYFVDQGVLAGSETFPSQSSVSLFDASNGHDTVLIPSIPGNSASIAIGGGRLYVGIGFGPEAGEIRSFSLTSLATALSSSTTIPWTTGTVFNAANNNSGAGMFFDHRGYLFVGGDNGVTVFDALGHAATYDDAGYTQVTYDPLDDRVLVTGFGQQQGIYPASAFAVPEPSTWALAAAGALWLAVGRARRGKRRSR